MKKVWSFFVNTLLVLISVSAILVLCELLFQRIIFSDWEEGEFLREPGAYADIYEDDHEEIFSQEYWILYYLFGKFFKPPDIPHPLLGWTANFDKNSLLHFNRDEVKDKRPVLLFGDSFSVCVGAKCFEEYLNSDSAFASKYHFLNYGVGGYGIDQIYLLAREVIPLYDDPIVIFGLMTRDMDRSILKFRTGQKPYFELQGDELVLKGVPMEPKASYFVDQHMPDIDSYLFRFARNSFRNYIPKEDPRTVEVVESIRSLNLKILEESFEMLENLDVEYRYLVFSPLYRSEGEWREILIRELLESNEIPYIFTKDLYEADSNYSRENLRFFEQDNGHPTDYQNELISDEIYRCLMDSAYASIVDSLNSRRYDRVKNTYDTDHLDYYIRFISRDEVWMQSIAEKAADKGISADSQLILDAAWMKMIDEKARDLGISRDSMMRLEADRNLKREINN